VKTVVPEPSRAVHDRRDALQEPPPRNLALRREAASPFIGKPKSTSAEVFLQDSVLLDEIRDDLGSARS
jgi:hypothetical protein